MVNPHSSEFSVCQENRDAGHPKRFNIYMFCSNDPSDLCAKKYILALHDQHRCQTSAYLLLALERLEIILFNGSSKKENYVEYKLTWHKEKLVKSPTSYFRLFPVNSFLFLYVVSPIIFVDIFPSIFVDLHMPVTFDFGVAFICIWSLKPIFIVIINNSILCSVP
jgi:hypothetical protein